MTDDRVILALPSKGAIAEPTMEFLKDCGLKVSKPNPRQYTGMISALPDVNVLFQRVKDVAYKVADGTAHLGITGYDVVCEYPHEDIIVIHDALGYGACELLVAVPETWIDVDSMLDLVEVSLDMRENKQRNLRVATTYTNQTRQFFHRNGIHHFTLVKAEGAIEAAPTLGYADVVVDLTQTGTTLRENHLRPLPDGVIVKSEACLIGNRRILREEPKALEAVRVLAERIDAARQGRKYYQITANIRGVDPQSIAARLAENPVTSGLQGPTIAPIYGTREAWFTITLIIRSECLMDVVEHLRSIGGTHTIATPVSYAFLHDSPTFTRLQQTLFQS